MQDSYGIYKKARDASWQILIDFKIGSLPVDIVQIASEAGISIVKDSEVHELYDNEAGASIKDGEKWYIVYDDSMVRGRIRFTIAHELGHIFLGHPLKEGHNSRTTFDTDKPAIETEADIFASRLLSPACVLWGLQVRSVNEIISLCDVSRRAAEIRMERMEELYKRGRFLTSPLEKKVYNQFKPFIDEKRFSGSR